MDDKKLEKIIKKLGKDTVAEMQAMDEVALRGVIVSAEQAMKKEIESLEKNEKYQFYKESIKALSAGKREVDSRQRSRIAYALQLLSDSGKEPAVDIKEQA